MNKVKRYALLEDQCDRLGAETVECAQIVGEALRSIECPDDGPVPFHIGHLPDMCRDLVAELTRLRAVEAAAQEVIAQSRIGRDPEGNRYYMIAPGDLRALAEACGRKG